MSVHLTVVVRGLALRLRPHVSSDPHVAAALGIATLDEWHPVPSRKLASQLKATAALDKTATAVVADILIQPEPLPTATAMVLHTGPSADDAAPATGAAEVAAPSAMEQCRFLVDVVHTVQLKRHLLLLLLTACGRPLHTLLRWALHF